MASRRPEHHHPSIITSAGGNGRGVAFGASPGVGVARIAPGMTEHRPARMGLWPGELSRRAVRHPGLHQPPIGLGSAARRVWRSRTSGALRPNTNGILASARDASLQPAAAL